ncbi:MAG: outer membrane lipoprotein carrier protein LolA [Treponema sp.]|nr:outer membrane lipoprotein carrier protein LolA [Treponema sp.]
MFIKKIKLVVLCTVLFCVSAAYAVFAQTITTAADFFKQISTYYGSIRDYEADVEITTGKSAMSGHVSFKRPDLLRIDFTKPDNRQVIVFNGQTLTIYLPGSTSVLQQNVSDSSAGGANLATPQGLTLMSRYYTIAYESSQNAEPLEEGSEENVIKLLLRRRNASEAFSVIKLAINPELKLIRRVEATTPQGDQFIFFFHNYALNQDIPDMRFVYDPPSSANNYNNFLFTE